MPPGMQQACPAMPAGYAPTKTSDDPLLFTKISDSCNQGGTTSRFMPLVGDRDVVDDVAPLAFGDLAVVMSLDGTTADVAHASHRFAIHREMLCAYAHDLAAMGCRVTETNDVAHRSAMFFGRGRIGLDTTRIVRHRRLTPGSELCDGRRLRR